MSRSNPCFAYDLGLVNYSETLSLQHELVHNRIKDFIPDVLLFVEHPPVLTIGRFIKEGEEDAEITILPEILEKEGISIQRTDRGGRITYHGPGQVVTYPILSLRRNRLGVRKYVWALEKSVIEAVKDFGISAQRREGYPGVWVGEEKLCAIGLRIIKWVSMHGIALNVSLDLRPFDYIVPCGIADGGVTSISKLLGKQVRVAEVKESILRAFSLVFDFKIEERGGIRQCLSILRNHPSG